MYIFDPMKTNNHTWWWNNSQRYAWAKHYL